MKSFAALAIIFLSAHCYAMTEKKEIKIKEFTYMPRGVLFFIDDSEKEKESIGAIGGDLLIALYQHAGPIIVSASLLRTVFSEDAAQMASLVGKDVRQLVQAYQSTFWSGDKAQQKAVLLKAVNFNPSQRKSTTDDSVSSTISSTKVK